MSRSESSHSSVSSSSDDSIKNSKKHKKSKKKSRKRSKKYNESKNSKQKTNSPNKSSHRTNQSNNQIKNSDENSNSNSNNNNNNNNNFNNNPADEVINISESDPKINNESATVQLSNDQITDQKVNNTLRPPKGLEETKFNSSKITNNDTTNSSDKKDSSVLEAEITAITKQVEAIIPNTNSQMNGHASNHSQFTSNHNSIFMPVLLSTSEDISKYYKPELLSRLNGFDLNDVSNFFKKFFKLQSTLNV
jgi:hypothetical protein